MKGLGKGLRIEIKKNHKNKYQLEAYVCGMLELQQTYEGEDYQVFESIIEDIAQCFGIKAISKVKTI